MTDFAVLLKTLADHEIAIIVGSAHTQDLDIVYRRSQTNLDSWLRLLPGSNRTYAVFHRACPSDGIGQRRNAV